MAPSFWFSRGHKNLRIVFSDTHGGSLVICDVLVGIEVGVIVGLKVSISVVDVSAVVTGVVEINGVGVELSVDGANVVVGVSGAEGVVLLVGVVESNVVELSGDVDVSGPVVTVLLVDDDDVVDFSVDSVVFKWSVVLTLEVELVSEVVVGELVSVPSVDASVDV